MKNENFRTTLLRLLKRYQQGKTSAVERDFIEHYYNLFDWHGFDIEEIPVAERARMKLKMKAELHRYIQHGHAKTNTLSSWKRMTIAASLIFAVAAGAAFYNHHYPQSAQLTLNNSGSIRPEKDKTILKPEYNSFNKSAAIDDSLLNNQPGLTYSAASPGAIPPSQHSLDFNKVLKSIDI